MKTLKKLNAWYSWHARYNPSAVVHTWILVPLLLFVLIFCLVDVCRGQEAPADGDIMLDHVIGNWANTDTGWEEAERLSEPLTAPDPSEASPSREPIEAPTAELTDPIVNTGNATVAIEPFRFLHTGIDITGDWQSVPNTGWGMIEPDLLSVAVLLLELQDKIIQKQKEDIEKREQQVQTLIGVVIKLVVCIILLTAAGAWSHIRKQRASHRKDMPVSPLTQQPW